MEDYGDYPDIALEHLLESNETILTFDRNINLAVGGGCITVWSFTSSALLSTLILSVKSLRTQFFYKAITSFLLSYLAMNIIVNPFTIYFDLDLNWQLGELLCKVYIIADNVFPGVACFALIIANIDRLLYVWLPTKYPGRLKEVASVVGCTIPWILGLVIIVPIWVEGEQSTEMIESAITFGLCMYVVRAEVAIGSPVATFFLPSILLLFLTVGITTGYTRLSPNAETETMLNVAPSARKPTTAQASCSEFPGAEHTLRRHKKNARGTVHAICILNFLFVVMWFPYHCLSSVVAMCEEHCNPPLTMLQVVSWIGPANGPVSVFILMLLPEIRNSIPRLCCRKKSVIERTELISRDQWVSHSHV